MAAAGGAQYLLFIGNADGAYIILVLQSLALTFCLAVDQNLVSNQIGTYTSKRLTAFSKGPLLCDGCGVGEEGGGIPGDVFGKVKLLVYSEKFVVAMVTITGIAWVIAVAYCMYGTGAQGVNCEPFDLSY
jgi:hypothetical protein